MVLILALPVLPLPFPYRFFLFSNSGLYDLQFGFPIILHSCSFSVCRNRFLVFIFSIDPTGLYQRKSFSNFPIRCWMIHRSGAGDQNAFLLDSLTVPIPITVRCPGLPVSLYLTSHNIYYVKSRAGQIWGC